jgi:phenylalanyl-tRNA synthetase beta chain
VRVHGYEQVPTHLPSAVLQVETVTETRVEEAALRRALIERGYSECINFAFVADDLLQRWGLADAAVALANPLSAELGSMRTALLPGLVEAARRNLARQHTRVRLFEIGRVFASTPAGPQEQLRLAGLAIGRAAPEHWDADKRAVDFFDLKGDVEQLLALSAAREVSFAPTTPPWLHPGRGAAVSRNATVIGHAGVLHPRLLSEIDLGVDVVCFEFDLAGLGARVVPRAGEVSRFPAVRRDLALVVPDTVPYQDFEAVIRAAAGPILRDLVLFDEYRGQGLRPDTRSLAIGLILQDDSRTLTDRDGDQAVGAVVAALARDFGAELRS